LKRKRTNGKKEIKSKTPEDRDIPNEMEPIYDQPLLDYKKAIEPPLTLSKIDDKNSNIISRFNSLLSCKEVRKKHSFQSFSPEKYKTYNETQRETLASRARVDFTQPLTPLDFVKKSSNHGLAESRHPRQAYRYTPTLSSRKIQTPIGRSPSQTPPRQSPVNVTSPENYSQQSHVVVSQQNVMKVGPQNVVLMKKQNSNQQLVYVQTNRVGGQVRTADGKIVQHQPVIISGDPVRRMDGKKMVYVNHHMHKIPQQQQSYTTARSNQSPTTQTPVHQPIKITPMKQFSEDDKCLQQSSQQPQIIQQMPSQHFGQQPIIVQSFPNQPNQIYQISQEQLQKLQSGNKLLIMPQQGQGQMRPIYRPAYQQGSTRIVQGVQQNVVIRPSRVTPTSDQVPQPRQQQLGGQQQPTEKKS